MTYLEILDTAVKIGLGALISGISAWWIARTRFKDELRHERLKRHQHLLESVAEQIEAFSHVLLRYWALVTEWVRNDKQGVSLLADRKQELERTKNDLFNVFKELTSAESKLLLLGYRDVQALLRAYGDSARSFRRSAYDGNKSLSEEQMEHYRAELLNQRDKLFSALSGIYRKET